MNKRILVLIYITAVILIGLTACGSVWDLQIADRIYIGETLSENIFGFVFSLIGIIPTFVGWSFLAASILRLAKKYEMGITNRRWLVAFSILLLILSYFYFSSTLYFSNANTFKIHFIAAYTIGLVVVGAAACLGYCLSGKCDDPDLLNKVLFLAVVSLVMLLIISVTKEIMCRPRFRFVLAMDDVGCYRNWWESGRALKERFDTGTITDEFASFPSGHSAYSMFAIFIFPLIADYIGDDGNRKVYLFVLGFLWWAATAFSRMTTGAHYLTDVSIAGLVTILVFSIVSAVRNACFVKKSL